MADKPSYRLKQLHGRLGDLVYQFTRVQFSHSPAPGVWSPPVNAYRCARGFAICADLAGVPKETIHLEIDKRKVRLQGRREIPEPKGKGEEAVQILAMEIDSGLFEREISLPADVDPQCVRAEYKDGFLWIYLPFRCEA
ncbi:MAG TPA: Hsp20/alpha crystallin family protein [Verrucomicrobiae bacterium]|nr:Hsp20/alpha crystallin family protein [Verrucomicrobiae bacterium]